MIFSTSISIILIDNIVNIIQWWHQNLTKPSVISVYDITWFFKGQHVIDDCEQEYHVDYTILTQLARFMGPTWGPTGSYRPQMGPMLAPWTLLSGNGWLINIPIAWSAHKSGRKLSHRSVWLVCITSFSTKGVPYTPSWSSWHITEGKVSRSVYITKPNRL